MGMGHMHRRPFVAHVDDADSQAGEMVPDGLYMPALKPKDAVDAPCLQRLGDPGGHALRVGVQILPWGL